MESERSRSEANLHMKTSLFWRKGFWLRGTSFKKMVFPVVSFFLGIVKIGSLLAMAFVVC